MDLSHPNKSYSTSARFLMLMELLTLTSQTSVSRLKLSDTIGAKNKQTVVVLTRLGYLLKEHNFLDEAGVSTAELDCS